MRLDLQDCGDAAVRVSCTGDRERAWRRVHGLAARLQQQSDAGLLATIPTYDAVLVEFDPVVTDHAAVRSLIRATASATETAGPDTRVPRQFDVPVAYGGEDGPDLERVAEQQGLTPAEIVAIHTARPLTVRCFGSPAGAPMLDGPDFPHPVPRLPSPRPHVPAGAVAVAGRQAVISARPAPGGWCVIGRTSLVIADVDHEPLSPFRPGDTISFRAIPAGQGDPS